MDSKRLLETFLDLVRIDSPSREEAAVAAYCRAALERAGCTVTEDGAAAQTGSNTGNLIAVLPGTRAGKVFFDAHMDNVQPCRGVQPQIRDGRVCSDGTTVLGGDDKVGVAAIIELMRSLSESGEPHPTVVGILTTCEEIGLLGSRALDSTLFDGVPCFVLDDSCAPGTVTIGAPSHYTFVARFSGRAAHAGVAPEAGISAIQMAADAVAAMPLGRLDEQTSSNVGTITGGSADNVVPAEATLTGECRSLVRARVEEVRGAMQEAMDEAAARRGGSVDVRWYLEYQGFLLSEDDPTCRLVLAAAEDCGLVPRTVTSLGGSDANVLGGKGCRALVLGTGMTDFHTTSESIAVADIEGTCRIAEAIVRRIGSEG